MQTKRFVNQRHRQIYLYDYSTPTERICVGNTQLQYSHIKHCEKKNSSLGKSNLKKCRKRTLLILLENFTQNIFSQN